MFISFLHFPDQENVWENHIILQYRKSSVKRFINFFFVFPDNMEAVAFSKDLVCVIYTLSCEKPDDDVIDSDIGFDLYDSILNLNLEINGLFDKEKYFFYF